jgi:hypothetical protein
MNGQPDYTAVSFAIAHLQSSQSTGVIAGAESLQQVLATASPVLDFRLAYYLAAFSISSYEGTLISSYVLNYKQVPNYDLQAFYVAYAATWLNGDGALTKSELQTFSQQLLADPNINVNTRLAIEDYLYQMDAL